MTGRKQSASLKRRYSIAIGSSSMKMIADKTDVLYALKSTGDTLLSKINIEKLNNFKL